MNFKPLHGLALGAALLSTVAGARGQGLVQFNNRLLPTVVAPIYGPSPTDPTLALCGNATTNGGSQSYTGPLLAGPGYTCELWGGPVGAPDAEMTPLSAAPFRTASGAGFIVAPPAVPVTGVPAGALATVQVRAWDNNGGTISNWAGALADPTVARGACASFTAGPLGTNAISAPRLTNMVSFNIHLPAALPQTLIYKGLAFSSLGSAALNMASNELTMSNSVAGSEGGVMVDARLGLNLLWKDVTSTNPWPAGTSFEWQYVRRGSGSNTVVGRLGSEQDGDVIAIRADFSAMGATNYHLRFLRQGVVVAERMVSAGVASGSTLLWRAQSHTNTDSGTPAPDGGGGSTDIHVYRLQCIDGYGRFIKNGQLCLVPCPGDLPPWPGYFDYSEVTYSDGGGLVVVPEVGTVDTVAWTYSGGSPLAGNFDTLQLAAANLPEFTFTDASINPFGLPMHALGQATFGVVSNGLPMVNNLGASGDDGVNMELGGAASVRVQLAASSSNALPVGAVLNGRAYGTLNGTPRQLLHSARLEQTSTNLALSADFSPLGAPLQSVQILSNGVVVYDSGPTATGNFRLISWIDSGLSSSDYFWYWWAHRLDGLLSVSHAFTVPTPGGGTTTVHGNQVVFQAVNPTNVIAGGLTAIAVTGTGMPSFTILSETVTPLPLAITSQPQSQTVPEGQAATFGVEAVGAAPFHYQWIFCPQPNWNQPTNVVGPEATLTISNTQPWHAGSYFVIVSNPSGAITSTVAVLNVDPALAACCSGPAPNLIVNGSFEQTLPPMTPNRFTWFYSAGAVPGWSALTASVQAPIEIWSDNAGIPAWAGTNHLEVNATSGDQVVFQTVNGLTPGCPVRLCFDYTGRFAVVGGSYNNNFDLVILSGGFSSTTPLNPPSYIVAGWQQYSITFTPGGASATIGFRGRPHYYDGSIRTEGGAHIDNVCLTLTPQPPTLVCAPDKTVECGSAWHFDPALAIDVCGGAVLPVTVVGTTVLSGPCPQVIRRTWQAVTPQGLSATCSQTVTVVDTTPPVLKCPPHVIRHFCGDRLAVSYRVSATDACDASVQINCSPASGSVFNAGVTWVDCTATDDCGNTSTCRFPVVLIDASVWQWFPAGLPDCYASPYESSFRGFCLNSAFPAVSWKGFDDPRVNRFFGHTWNPPPLATYLDGWLVARMQDYRCTGISENDTINLGLLGCNSGSSWAWSRPLGSLGTDLGLPSTSPWCNIPAWGPEFALHLSDLPPLGGGHTVLSTINAPAGGPSWARRLDLLVQDDTRVDYAWLRMRRCPPHHIIGGFGVTVTNAEVVYGPDSWTLAKDPASTNGFSAEFDLGSATGVRLNFNGLTFANHSNGTLNVSQTVLEGQTVAAMSLAANNDGTVRYAWMAEMAGTNVADVVTFSNGVAVASNRLPATAGTELARFPASASITQIGLVQGGSLFLSLDTGNGGTLGYEVRLTGNTIIVWPLASVTLAAEGFEQLTLGPPEVGVNRTVDPEDVWWDDWFAAVSGDAIARAEDGQLTLSALDAERPGTMGLRTCPGCAGEGTNGNGGITEFRATLQTSLGLFSPVPSNASVQVACIVDPLDGQHDEIAMQFDYNGSAWSLTTTRTNAPFPVRHVAYWQSNDYRTVSMSGPVSISVSELPQVYWPAITWFVDDDIGHRLLWNSPVTVRINGTAYETTELRFLTDGPGGARPLKGLRVETTGAEALVLSSLETGRVRYRLEPPVVDGGDIIIRGNSLGGVIECSPSLTGPWTTVPVIDGEVRISITNAPAKFFRVKGN